MSNLVHNEQVRLAATFWNNLSIAALFSVFLVPAFYTRHTTLQQALSIAVGSRRRSACGCSRTGGSRGCANETVARSGGATALLSLRAAELVQRFLMQEANLSQVSLRFCNVVPYGTQFVPDCNLARMIQRGFKALDAKRSTRGKGISLLYVVSG